MGMNNRIQMLSSRRFLSHHLGAEVYYDSRHRVIKTSFSGGGHGALVKELQPDGSYRNQILFIVSPEGKRSAIEFVRNALVPSDQTEAVFHLRSWTEGTRRFFTGAGERAIVP